MAFDFKKLARGDAFSSITDPAALFDALPSKAPGLGYLRAVQKTVLDAWSGRRDERDLVLKTNTGGGKTIVALLILQTSIHEGLLPALYVAPDPHLQSQVVREAQRLGLAVVTDPESGRFLSGDAIGVTTMHVLVNGKTRFGLRGAPHRQPIRVGTVVIDDAHAALALAEEKTYLRIPRVHQAWQALVSLFEDDLKQQGLNAFLGIKDNDGADVLRIPYWAWHDRHQMVLETLRPHRADPTFEWSWPLVSDLLPLCQAVVTADAIEIVPPCPPIEKIPSFANARRRVYLTATLADDSVLVTHFDANPDSIATPIVPESAADLGDRLVLAPQELNPAIVHPDVRTAARAVALRHNVVVLVPSHRQAAVWNAEAESTVSASAEISAIVERLKAGHVGLVVIVNRYDGIDLPDDACRLLVIDGLPQAYTGVERREAAALLDSEAMVTRQLQRLEQGMGRGVRSRDDRCAVVLVGPRLTQLVARSDVADRLSPATRAQLELSRRVAAHLHGADMAALLEVIAQVVDGDAAFREVSRQALVGVTYGPPYLSPPAAALRRAYDAAASGRAEDASSHADEAVKLARRDGDERLAGWLGETLATYLYPLDPVRAQAALRAAAERNPAVLRPLGGLAYKKVTAAEQSQQASEYLQERYPTGTQLRLGVEAVLADLVWDNERTNATEAALVELIQHLGLAGQRPEQEFGQGSDVLWALGNHRYAVVEAKTGATAATIWKRDVNQLAGSVNWFREQYGKTPSLWPVIVHPHADVDRSATPPDGTRVLTQERLEALRGSVRAYANALATRDTYRDPVAVAQQLEHHKLTGGTLIQTFTVAARRQR